MYKVGIVGFGVVGKRRLQCIQSHPKLAPVAVCDQSAGEMDAMPSGVRTFSDYRTLLEQDLDIIFVCITNDISPAVTKIALEKGRHVFCEKPPGRTLEDVVSVMRTHNRVPSLKLKYGFNHRYHDSVIDALEIIRNNSLGKIINARGIYGKSKNSNWRTERAKAGGGILLDQGIHMVDLIRLFIGEVVDVKSFISNSFWNHDVEDNAYALLRSEDGVVAVLHSSATQWQHRFNLELTFQKGAVILDGILSGSKSYGDETITVVHRSVSDHVSPNEERKKYSEDRSWQREIDEFVDTIEFDREVKNGSILDSLKTMHVVYQIYCADDDWQKQWQLTDYVSEDVWASFRRAN